MVLPILQSRRPNSHHMRVETVINGTLNFVFSEIERGRTLSEACSEALALGYAEPGATDEVSLINGELADIVMKTCVLFNTTLSRKKSLSPFFAKGFKLSLDDIENLSDVAADYRFVVTFSNTTGSMGEYLGARFETEQDGWRIAGGFRRISRSSAFDWVPNGVSNALHIVEGDRLGKGGSYTVSGPGAGIEPTTTAMLNDFERLMTVKL